MFSVISKDKLIMITLFALTGGIWAAETGLSLGFQVVIGVTLLLLFTHKNPLLLSVNIVALGFCIGLIRGQNVQSQLRVYNDYIGDNVTIVASVQDDPTRAESGQKEFYAHQAQMLSGRKLPGKIRVRGFGVDGVRRGDLIKIEGKMREGFGPYQAQVSFAQIEAIGRKPDPLADQRARFFSGINSLISDPENSLGLGFVVGLRALLPDELLDSLGKTGLTHIVAVSGYNLTVIIRLTRRIFAKHSRFLAVFASAMFIAIFLGVTGLVPSVFRASIVAGFSLGAWYYGLNIRTPMLIALGASITSFINPLFTWTDIGWWLSFLAFTGVMIIAPPLSNILWRGKSPRIIGQIMVETLSAQIMALPLIAYTFGEVSVISPLANVLVNPMIPLAMALVAVTGFCYLWIPFVAGWVAWPTQVLLSAMLDLIELLARVPGALMQVDITAQTMLIIYFIIGIFTLRIYHGRSAVSASYLVE